MAMKKKAVTGMRDILPEEMEVRNYVLSVIRDTYRSYGFSAIETPHVEHLENLLSKQGGENEKLIFKILKRGEKLDLSGPTTEEAVSDCGLRYDLTLPLSRYYACHQSELPSPFKALQIGSVFRADRPQRGRFRQFTQCDIDILGEASWIAETDLILATSRALSNLGFKDFTIRINDRKLLKATADKAGFTEDQYEQIFIILDKMDKIGEEGVREELGNTFGQDKTDAYIALLKEDPKALIEETGSSLTEIIAAVEKAKSTDFRIVYDPTLVRGMGYYTGPIFEISMDEYGGSVGGGGRYDEMIGRFTGQNTPAAGFSIGFERIIMLLMERGFQVPGEHRKCAFLIDKKMPKERMTDIWAEAEKLRREGITVDIAQMKKNRKFQKEQLEKNGYTEIRDFYSESLQH